MIDADTAMLLRAMFVLIAACFFSLFFMCGEEVLDSLKRGDYASGLFVGGMGGFCLLVGVYALIEAISKAL